MGMFEGCVLACDIDGTLMNNGYIPPRNLEKIEFFINQGGRFSISTGRSVGAISSVTEKIKQISPSIVFNGCMIYDYGEKKVLFEKCITQEDKLFIKEILSYKYNFGVEIHSGYDVYTLNRTDETDKHQIYEKLPTIIKTYEDVKNYKWNKILLTLDSEKDYEILEKFASKGKYNSKFVRTSAIFYGVKHNYFEQLPLGVSKAEAITELCRLLKIKENGVFAMGDYYNDIEMLKKADISAAPHDSPDEVKSVADFIAGACEDGAVADFIDYLTQLNRKD